MCSLHWKSLQEISILKEELQQNSAPITFEQVKSEVYVLWNIPP
jgi:hypothetical protein